MALSAPVTPTLQKGEDSTSTDHIIEPQVSASIPNISPYRSLGLCSECGVRIKSVAEACQAMGCIYHNVCFVCCCCRRSLRGKTFYKDQSRVYCEEDYLYCGFQRTTEKCAGCGHIIAEVILQALGRPYHPGCFRCTVCNECLDGQPYAVDMHNAVYCLCDYYLVHAPRCARCGMPILPEKNSDEIIRVVAMDKEFHLDCYRCDDCNISLGDSNENSCYPLVESRGGIDSTSQTSLNSENMTTNGQDITRLLCLNCHLVRLGAASLHMGSGKDSPASPSTRAFPSQITRLNQLPGGNNGSPVHRQAPNPTWFK